MAGGFKTKPKKRRGLRGRKEQYGLPPHPVEVKRGQRYWPRAGGAALRVVGVRGGRVELEREEPARRRTGIARERLLATDDSAQGRIYAFMGRRAGGVRSVLRVEDPIRRIVTVPEWHPGRPFPYAAPLPVGTDAGGFVGCRLDFGLPPCGAQDTGMAMGIRELSDPDPDLVREAELLLAGGIPGRFSSAAGAHPTELRPGQRSRPRSGRSSATLLVEQVQDGRARCFNGRRAVSVSVARLLATDEGGGGRFYDYRGGGVRGRAGAALR